MAIWKLGPRLPFYPFDRFNDLVPLTARAISRLPDCSRRLLVALCITSRAILSSRESLPQPIVPADFPPILPAPHLRCVFATRFAVPSRGISSHFSTPPICQMSRSDPDDPLSVERRTGAAVRSSDFVGPFIHCSIPTIHVSECAVATVARGQLVKLLLPQEAS
jgi:hypothetical protein